MSLEPTLAKLLEAWQDGGLSDAEEAALLLQLDNDAELRRRFAEQVAILGATRAAAEQGPRWLALFDLLEYGQQTGGDSETLSFEDATMIRIRPPARRFHPKRSALAALAAVLTLLATAWFLSAGRGTRNASKPIAKVPSEPTISAVAVVIGASSVEGHPIGTYLKPGIISKSAGWLTLQTINGVSVTFDAPFRAELISHDRILLSEGRARVRVPEGAEGFRLESPAFDVVDLGTEFAAVVNPDGTGTCRVFEGKADVSLLDSIGEVKRTKRLSASESVRVDPAIQDLRLIEEADADYPEIKQPPRPNLALRPSYAAEMMLMQPAGYWRFEEIRDNEVADEIEGGARLQAAGTAAIATESGGNHSGALMWKGETEFFQIPSRTAPLLEGDFSICLFAQFEWLQNFALISAMRYDDEVQGNSFVLQAYGSFRRTGMNGTGLHAVLRDPPAWDGGVEVFGNTLLRPLHWHHVAAVRAGNQLTLYLDGVVVGCEPAGARPLDCRQIYVGRLNANAAQSRMEARGLVGHIDELAIFERALTEEEIRRLAMP